MSACPLILLAIVLALVLSRLIVSHVVVHVAAIVVAVVMVLVHLFCDTLENDSLLALHLFRRVVERVAWLNPPEYVLGEQ